VEIVAKLRFPAAERYSKGEVNNIIEKYYANAQ